MRRLIWFFVSLLLFGAAVAVGSSTGIGTTSMPVPTAASGTAFDMTLSGCSNGALLVVTVTGTGGYIDPPDAPVGTVCHVLMLSDADFKWRISQVAGDRIYNEVGAPGTFYSCLNDGGAGQSVGGYSTIVKITSTRWTVVSQFGPWEVEGV